jgi:hypothetical protein
VYLACWLQEKIKLLYRDICDARNETMFATYVDPGLVTIAAPVEGLSIQEGTSFTVTVWDSDLDTDPLSIQVLFSCHVQILA